ncbi:crAss001_48 related protein [Limosilactobacillus mucosae]|uniref:crAss001_48 related protein n=1 Tax=Limosilactobacillus mucosae TaxID=97478 RepID=UPI000FFCC137|nr:hypothetical protein [Limosilactobacillus mucosae]RXA58163.1 hypothetical protein EQ839_02945 [Limosilactobacillus mucosae]
MNVDIIERLDQERAELEHRLEKLIVFLNKQEKEQTVSDYQLDLLHRQWLHMQGYKNILDLRIDDLNRK